MDKDSVFLKFGAFSYNKYHQNTAFSYNFSLTITAFSFSAVARMCYLPEMNLLSRKVRKYGNV